MLRSMETEKEDGVRHLAKYSEVNSVAPWLAVVRLSISLPSLIG